MVETIDAITSLSLALVRHAVSVLEAEHRNLPLWPLTPAGMA